MQIIWSNESYIHTWNAQDVVQIYQALSALNLQDHQDFVICPLRITHPIGRSETIWSKYPTDTACPFGWVFTPSHGLLSLFSRIHHWHNHTPCPGIQRPLKPLLSVPRKAHQWSTRASISNCRYHSSNERGMMSTVLGVHNQPIEAKSR